MEPVEAEEVVTGAVDAVESGVLDEPAHGVGVRCAAAFGCGWGW
jgi:hypothetical protein